MLNPQYLEKYFHTKPLSGNEARKVLQGRLDKCCGVRWYYTFTVQWVTNIIGFIDDGSGGGHLVTRLGGMSIFELRLHMWCNLWRARERLTLGYLQPRKRRQQVTGGKRYTPCNVTRLRIEVASFSGPAQLFITEWLPFLFSNAQEEALASAAYHLISGNCVQTSYSSVFVSWIE